MRGIMTVKKDDNELSLTNFQGLLTEPANTDSLESPARELLCYMQKEHAALESSFHCSNKALKHLSNYGIDVALDLRETQAAITLAYAYLVGEEEDKAISMLHIAQKSLPSIESVSEILQRALLLTHQALKCTLAATLTMQQYGECNLDEVKTANSAILKACRAAIDAYIAESIVDDKRCSIIKSH